MQTQHIPQSLRLIALASHKLLAALLAQASCCTVLRTAPENGLEGLARAMRRREVLQRADELVPHSVGRVLLALLASTLMDRTAGYKSVSCSAPADHHVHPRSGSA